ncbi:MAG: SRPBCC family protein [Cyanobacteria bacterium P01_F01_bin.42]
MALLQSTDQSDSDFEQSVSGVEIDVQVRKIESRKRQIEAKIELPYPIENVWNVLTDYEALSEFIPNLELSHCIERPDGGIRVEQIGSQCALMLKFSARVVLDMEEHYPKVLSFDMVEGDFNGFNGQWRLAPCREGSGNTELTYSVKVWPKITMPIVAVEQRLAKDLPINLQAIRRRLDALYGSREICAA